MVAYKRVKSISVGWHLWELKVNTFSNSWKITPFLTLLVK